MTTRTMLTKLSKAQEARLAEFRDEYLKRGLSTEPADRHAAEEAIADAYRAANMAPPRTFIWLASPMAGAIAAAMIAAGKQRAQVWAQVGDQVRAQVRAQVRDQVRDQVGAQVGDQVRAQVGDQVRAQVRAQVGAQVWDQVWAQVWAQVRAQVWAQVGDQVGDQVRAQVGDQVWDQVRAQVGDQVWAQVRAQVGAQVGDQVRDQVGAQVGDQVRAQVGAQVRAQVRAQVWAQVRDQVWAQVRAQVWAQVGRCGYGQHDAGWLAFYAYFAETCGSADALRLAPLSRLCASAGWWWPFEHLCVVTDRPEAICRDDQNRLHSETGHAIHYRDGWGVCVWHGTRIPDEWMSDRASLTAKVALTWQNIEQRRVALEIVGWNNVLRELKAKVVDEHPDPECGSLVEVQLPDLPRKSRFIRAMCGTKREFAIGVPPEIKTVAEGQAWLTGLPIEQFQFPTLRT